MIRSWWSGLAKREQGLLVLAAGLTCLFGGWFGVLVPLSAAKNNAHAEFDAMAADKVAIERALAKLGGQGEQAATPASDFDAFRTEFTREAQLRGLSITRLQSNGDSTLQLVMGDVDPALVFAWLAEVADRPGGRVVRASFMGQDGKLEAVLELQGAAQ